VKEGQEEVANKHDYQKLPTGTPNVSTIAEKLAKLVNSKV
jgi:hypothetical protein